MKYKNAKICLTTKHKKQEAIGPAFNEILGARVESIELDTDLLGTFSGEIERKESALDAARSKCELGMIETGYKYGLSSEGSFGPHPSIFFIPANIEILYFIDNENDFHLHESILSINTNFKTAVLDQIEQLALFAEQVGFPSHALIIRANMLEDGQMIFKGIQDKELLIDAFKKSQSASLDQKVWIETDMRAHMNPTRMSVIKELSLKLANRLKTSCPSCIVNAVELS